MSRAAGCEEGADVGAVGVVVQLDLLSGGADDARDVVKRRDFEGAVGQLAGVRSVGLGGGRVVAVEDVSRVGIYESGSDFGASCGDGPVG